MDPYFDVATADIRGFDLGDDDELLAELEARRERGDDLAPRDWLKLAVVQLRTGRVDEALGCLERTARLGHAVALVRYLQAQLALDRDDVYEAAALLDLAQRANHDESLVPSAELIHAFGSVSRAEGDPDQALDHYRKALEFDEASVGRWRALGELLLELGRTAEGRDAVLRAVEEDPDDHESLYQLAAANAQHGDADGAAHWLSTLLQRAPEARVRAAMDPRFEALDDPHVAGLLEPPEPPNLDWLAPYALDELREHPAVQPIGLRWLSREESDELRQRLDEAYGRGPLGTMHTPATLRLSRELLETMVPVAYGPSSTTRDRIVEPTILFVDSAKKGRLFLALSESYPPFLWLDFDTDAGALLEALSAFFPKPQLTRLDMPRTARGFMGYRLRFGVPSPYSGDIEPAGATGLDRHFAINPFVETTSWGSAYLDDPWPEEIPEQPGYVNKVAAYQRQVNQQTEGSVWSISRRTRHSRSYLSVELHHRDLFVAEVRYRPSRHSSVVARMNEHFGCDYPEDMPLDAVAALLGFQFDGAEDLITRLDTTSEPEEIAGLLTVLSALLHSDLRIIRFYRRYMNHPDSVVRTTLCNIFAAYNYESLLEEMSVIEPDVGIRQQIEDLLDNGIVALPFDPYADPQDSGPLSTGSTSS